MTMTMTLDDLRPFGNTQQKLSTEQMRAIRFYASAHMTVDEIASRARASVRQVEDYCYQVRINVK